MKFKHTLGIILAILSLHSFGEKNDLTKPKFDFYLLSTQWIPGWCNVGTGASFADLNDLKACQAQRTGKPLMFRGLWPENDDGTYPSNCSQVPNLNERQLTFSNPYIDYLDNARSFINHEWKKHGTCSTYYEASLEKTNYKRYYKQVNQYFKVGIKLYQDINIPSWNIETSSKNMIRALINLNPHIPKTSILVLADRDKHKHLYLTGLWFCVNKNLTEFISCPKAVQSLGINVTKNILTR